MVPALPLQGWGGRLAGAWEGELGDLPLQTPLYSAAFSRLSKDCVQGPESSVNLTFSPMNML